MSGMRAKPRSPKRERRFCPYCGAIIPGDARACRAHSDLPALDRNTEMVVELPTVTRDEPGCLLASDPDATCLGDTPTSSRSARSAGSEAAGHDFA